MMEKKFNNPICPHCNCGEGYVYEKHKGKWFCLECWDYIEPVEYNSKEHKKSMKRIFSKKEIKKRFAQPTKIIK